MVVRGMLSWHCPPIVILAMLLLMWNPHMRSEEDCRSLFHRVLGPPKQKALPLCPLTFEQVVQKLFKTLWPSYILTHARVSLV